MYEVRGRPLVRCLLSPLSPAAVFVLSLGAAFLLLVGGWIALGAAAFLAVFEWRSYAAVLRADSTGVVVTNRFFRHYIAWSDVRGIWIPKSSAEAPIPTVVIQRRGSIWFFVGIYATLGMGRAERWAVAQDLITLAREGGHEIAVSAAD